MHRFIPIFTLLAFVQGQAFYRNPFNMDLGAVDHSPFEYTKKNFNAIMRDLKSGQEPAELNDWPIKSAHRYSEGKTGDELPIVY